MESILTDKLLKEAKEAFKACVDYESNQREMSQQEYSFARLGNQWPEGVRKEREIDGRPCLTINRLPSFIRQVVNDARQNKPAIRTIPVDDNADVETSEIINGLIRNIEYRSDAGAAYDTAIEWAASSGIGYFRINVDYVFNDQFEKDITIERVMNPMSVYGDPDSTAVDSSDWNKAFVTEWMPTDQFKETYPNAEEVDWDFTDARDRQEWFEEDHILIAEYWKREEVTDTLLMLSDGQVMYQEAYENGKEIFDALGIEIEFERETSTRKVTQHIMNGQEILEENEWQGQFIPIIPVYGEEVVDDGKRYFHGLTHQSQDAQRNYNYWRTASTELVALAPKAPWVGEEGAFDADDNWATANTKNHPYLEVSRGQQLPVRQPFAGVPAGALQEAINSSDDIKSILGMFDASLGNSVNEVSGIAIQRRNQEGDTSTYHFQDNLTRAIRHAGRIIVDLIPHVYTRPRILRILGEDGEPQEVPVNQPIDPNTMQPMDQGFEEGMERIFDLTAGKYDVQVKAGPNFTTKRQEAADQMMDMLRAFPQAAPYVGDLLVKNLDWPGADEIAKRLKAMLPAQLREDEQDPMVAQLQQQLEQAQGIIKQLSDMRDIEEQKIAVDRMNAETKRIESGIKQTSANIDAYEANTERMEAKVKQRQGNDKLAVDLLGTVNKARPSSAPRPQPGMTPRGINNV